MPFHLKLFIHFIPPGFPSTYSCWKSVLCVPWCWWCWLTRKGAWQVLKPFLGEKTSLHRDDFFREVERLRNSLLSIRESLKSDSASVGTSLSEQTLQKLRDIITNSDSKMTDFAKDVMAYTLQLITSFTEEPLCSFAVIAMGSFGRGEATPYSDLEYGFSQNTNNASVARLWRYNNNDVIESDLG